MGPKSMGPLSMGQLKVEKLKALEEEAQKTFALERMSKQKCEVELFNLRAEVSELRVRIFGGFIWVVSVSQS